MERTLGGAFERSGVGLHSGQRTSVRVLGDRPGAGRYFVRTDLPGRPQIPAHLEAVAQTTLSTELERDGAKVRTVEHLLAALAASGIDNARIEIDGGEVPLLDGSAKEWNEAIAAVGARACSPEGTSDKSSAETPQIPAIRELISVREGDAFVTAMPSEEMRFTYGIDFAYAPIGNQWHSWNPEREGFASAIAPARTFGFVDRIEQLRQAGLIKGGSLDNALVCDREQWLNPPLRFANEPVRHKLLDLVGDLSLLGKWPRGHFLAYKASHHLHVRLARAIARSL
ncbi:MAG: UDP-3-O-acyl-N-acetylglucosamine deacetylase [Cyanobacteria bacterium SBLK]|nr:UDP-3-O-acyl-N-acetylglucosamine deacetylase [Cyanobacteria bacterium SBLK]